jgi:hypothetical protein
MLKSSINNVLNYNCNLRIVNEKLAVVPPKRNDNFMRKKP